MRGIFLGVDELEHDDAVGEAQRGLYRVRQSLLGAGFDGKTVDDHLDVVLLLLLELGRVGERMHHAVNPNAAVTLGVQLLEEVDELTLARADHGSEHLEPQALLHIQHLIHDLLRGLLGDLLPAHRAVWGPGPRIQQTQVVVDLGDGAHSGPRVAVGGFLVDRYRRRQPLDEINIGLVHLSQELAGVRGQRFDVPALPLGKDGVKGQTGLPGSGQAREDDEAVPG